MSTASFPDINALLEPISTDQPCGEDMSFSAEFDQIQEARRQDDATLDQGEWITAIKEADWQAVLQTTQSLLTTRTKDLRLASWLTEAATKTAGIGGMAAGFQLISALLDRYWDALHPLPDDGDIEQRIGNISWLITRSIQLTKALPLVKGKGQSYGLADQESARALQLLMERSPDEAPSDVAQRVTMQQFRDAQRATARSFYQQTLSDCADCRKAIEELTRMADLRLGMDGPSCTPLKTAIETYADAIERLARENGVVDPASQGSLDIGETESGQHDPEASAGTGHSSGGLASGPIRNRDQALQQLRLVAEFFRRTEPHSPVAYLADKAAKWGEMPLHVWLKAVLKEQGAMARFEDLLGIEDQPDEQ